jgi:biotin operon repressor
MPYTKTTLTARQQEVLETLLSKNYHSINQLSLDLKITKRVAYRHISILRKKGFLNGFIFHRSQKGDGVRFAKRKILGKKPFIRLHGVEFHVVPFYPISLANSIKYQQTRQKGNRLQINGWTVRLFPKALEIYSGEGHDWRGETTERVTRMMEYDFNKLLYKLEERFGIGIIKDQKHNITLVNSHYAQVNSELPGALRQENEQKVNLTIYGDDGKAWFKIDESWNMDEAETIHPQEAELDSKKIFEKYLNDLRKNNPPTNSELATHLMQSINLIMESMRMQDVYNANIVKHLKVLDLIQEHIGKIAGNKVEKPKPSILPKLLQGINTKDDVAKYRLYIQRLSPEENFMLFATLKERGIFG